jgi:hypothetical protein
VEGNGAITQSRRVTHSLVIGGHRQAEFWVASQPQLEAAPTCAPFQTSNAECPECWTEGAERDSDRLGLPYRVLLSEQGPLRGGLSGLRILATRDQEPWTIP